MVAMRFFFISCFLFLLTSCGFHLRGNYNLPSTLQQVYVSYDQPFDPFVEKLKASLSRAKVSLVEQSAQAKYVLRINKIAQNSVLQATSTTGQINTYTMQYVINFELTDAAGSVLLPAQDVQSNGNYTLSSTQLLTNFNQQPALTSGLQQDAINQLLFRLSGKTAKRALHEG